MEEIARVLIETGSVLVRPEEPFRLVSGRLSPVYVDCRRLISFPEARRVTTDALAEVVRHEIGLDAIDVIAGGETAGIPFASFLALELDLPMIYVRKAPKGHGQSNQIEGVLERGGRVLLVEDLVTDGRSKLAFQEGIIRAGGRVEHCLCVFEYYSEQARLTEARRRLQEHGITLHSLTNWDELLGLMRSQKALSDDHYQQVLEFLRDPEGYSRRAGG